MSIPGIQGREATTAATAAVVASPSRRSTGLRPIHRWRRRGKPGRARARRGHSGSGRAEQKRRRVERGQRQRAGSTIAVGRRAAEGFRRRRQQVASAGDLMHHAAEAGGVGGDVGGGQLPRRARAAFRGAPGCGSRAAEVVVVVRRRRGGGRRLGWSRGGREVAEELVMVDVIGKDGEPWRRRRGGGGG